MTPRWAWMVVAYVVVSTRTYDGRVTYEIQSDEVSFSGPYFYNKQFVEDLAEGLNEAHKRRTSKGITVEQKVDLLEDKIFIMDGQRTLDRVRRGCGPDDYPLEAK